MPTTNTHNYYPEVLAYAESITTVYTDWTRGILEGAPQNLTAEKVREIADWIEKEGPSSWNETEEKCAEVANDLRQIVTRHGAEIAARMTPEARSERARKAAMARHYARLIPVMVEALTEIERISPALHGEERNLAPEVVMAEYPSLQSLDADAYKWVRREARRAMGY